MITRSTSATLRRISPQTCALTLAASILFAGQAFVHAADPTPQFDPPADSGPQVVQTVPEAGGYSGSQPVTYPSVQPSGPGAKPLPAPRRYTGKGLYLLSHPTIIRRVLTNENFAQALRHGARMGLNGVISPLMLLVVPGELARDPHVLKNDPQLRRALLAATLPRIAGTAAGGAVGAVGGAVVGTGAGIVLALPVAVVAALSGSGVGAVLGAAAGGVALGAVGAAGLGVAGAVAGFWVGGLALGLGGAVAGTAGGLILGAAGGLICGLPTAGAGAIVCGLLIPPAVGVAGAVAGFWAGGVAGGAAGVAAGAVAGGAMGVLAGGSLGALAGGALTGVVGVTALVATPLVVGAAGAVGGAAVGAVAGFTATTIATGVVTGVTEAVLELENIARRQDGYELSPATRERAGFLSEKEIIDHLRKDIDKASAKKPGKTPAPQLPLPPKLKK